MAGSAAIVDGTCFVGLVDRMAWKRAPLPCAEAAVQLSTCLVGAGEAKLNFLICCLENVPGVFWHAPVCLKPVNELSGGWPKELVA